MPYSVKFTDPLKPAVEVFDNTTNSTDTSLKFSGRNTTNYGTAVAENFLHLLENFAGANSPPSPIEGQLWYNNVDEILYVNDGSGDNGWQTASGVRTGTAVPTAGKLGDIWVNTNDQQIFIYTGTTWILVGPLYSSGSKSGPIVETLIDVDNITHSVVTMYAEGVPVSIISTIKNPAMGIHERRFQETQPRTGRQMVRIIPRKPNITVTEKISFAALMSREVIRAVLSKSERNPRVTTC